MEMLPALSVLYPLGYFWLSVRLIWCFITKHPGQSGLPFTFFFVLPSMPLNVVLREIKCEGVKVVYSFFIRQLIICLGAQELRHI